MNKRILILVTILLYAVSAAAQMKITSDKGDILTIEQSKNSKITTIGVCGIEFGITGSGDNSINVPGSRKKRGNKGTYYSNHLGIFELGFNIVASSRYDAYPENEKGFIELNTGKSTQVNLNIVSGSVSLNSSKTLGFVIGAGLQFNNYRFYDPVTLRKTDGMIHPEPIDLTTTRFKKSKFTSFGIWVPVMFEAAIRNDFFVAAGVYGSLNMCGHTKYSAPKSKMHGIYIAPLTGGVTARIGFDKIYIMGNYNLSYLFMKDKGPEINMLSVGFGLGF